MSRKHATIKRRVVSILQMTQVACPAVLVVLLTLLQGGFYAGASCVVAVAATVTLGVMRICCRRWEPAANVDQVGIAPLTGVLVLVVGLACLTSSFVHGASAAMLLKTGWWFAVAGLSLWCMPRSRALWCRALNALAVAGVGLAALGVLMYMGVLTITGALSAGRLMFTFQYANTAGLLFAVVTVLCVGHGERGWLLAAVVPAIALLLTQSWGAVIVCLLGLLALIVRRVRDVNLQTCATVGVAAGMIAVGATVALILRARIAQAGITFVERLVQMLDASTLLMRNLPFGIGPGQWQLVYPVVQSAPYVASRVHCSYLQLALDGGIVAAAALITLIALGLRRLAQQGAFVPLVCASMMVVHALIDFDFEFSSILVVACLLLGMPNERRTGVLAHRPNEHVTKPALLLTLAVRGSRFTAALWWVLAACSVAMSCATILLDGRVRAVETACAQGEARVACARMDAMPSLANDATLRFTVIEALLAGGDYEAVVACSEAQPYATGGTGLARVIALDRLGSGAAAARTLSATLATRPYDLELLDAARTYVDEGSSEVARPALIRVFNEAATRTNDLLIQGHAAWLAPSLAHDHIETIGEEDA